MDLTKNIRKFLFLLLFLLFINYSFSTCNLEPKYIKIYSGDYYLGEFHNSDEIAILPNIGVNPIRVKYFFENHDDCFNSSENLKMKLFPSANYLNSNSFEDNYDEVTGLHNTEFDFEISSDITLSNSFTSSFQVISKNDEVFNGNLNFIVDKNPPIITSLSKPNGDIFKPGTNIEIGFSVQDDGAGLDLLNLLGGKNQYNIVFNDSNKTYSGVYSENITNTETFFLNVKDKLGNEISNNFTLYVDSNPPLISNIQKSYSFENNIRRVSFSLDIEDESFKFLTGNPIIKANFSSINPSAINLVPNNCIRDSDTKFTCYFDNIEIKLNKESNVQISFNVEDLVGNSNELVFSQDIFVDYDGPEILDFYMINSNGAKNIFSAYDNSTKIYFKFKDASISNDGLFTIPRIIPKFSDLNFITTDDCPRISEDTIECVWNIGDKMKIFSLKDYGNETFQITVIDNFGNPSSSSFIAKYDNVNPIINNISFEETTSIKDGIIQSGEIVIFKLYLSDKNLEYDRHYFVDGLFNQISNDIKYLNWTQANCHPYNSSSTECVFNGIKVANGFLNRNITFKISDSAGNYIYKQFPVKIYKISNESNQVFIQNKNFKILNPINRNVIINSGVNTWFEGDLEFIPSINPSTMHIINYQIKTDSCKTNDSVLMPVNEGNYMYPNPIRETIGNYEEDRKFALNIKIAEIPNYNDLNDKNMTCVMSVLYRDNTTIYPPELVNFSLTFGFYDLPRGSILRANAESILEKANEVEFMNGFFGSLYKTYNFFNSICTVIGTADGVINGVDQIWTYISIMLHGTVAGSPVAMAGDKALHPVKGFLSMLDFGKNSFVKKACDWITCKNGGILGAAFDKSIKDIKGFKELYEAQGKISSAVCSTINNAGNKLSKRISTK